MNTDSSKRNFDEIIRHWLLFWKDSFDPIGKFHELIWDDRDARLSFPYYISGSELLRFISNEMDALLATDMGPIVKALGIHYEHYCWAPPVGLAKAYKDCLDRIGRELEGTRFKTDALLFIKECEGKEEVWKRSVEVDEARLHELIVEIHKSFGNKNYKVKGTIMLSCARLHGLLANVPLDNFCKYLSHIDRWELYMLIPLALVLLDYYGNNKVLIDAFSNALERTGLLTWSGDTIDTMRNQLDGKQVQTHDFDPEHFNFDSGSVNAEQRPEFWTKLCSIARKVPLIPATWTELDKYMNTLKSIEKCVQSVFASVSYEEVFFWITSNSLPLEEMVLISRLLWPIYERYGIHDGNYGDFLCMDINEQWKGKNMVLDIALSTTNERMMEFQFFHDRDDFLEIDQYIKS